MSTFALDLQKFAEKTGKKADLAVGLIVAKIAQKIDELSPVGDESYWKSPPPKGYVGGRFRGSWQLGVGAEATGRDTIDPTGEATLGAIKAAIPDDASGRVYYLTNGLPYAQAIEDGHSERQAPFGVVGRTTLIFGLFVDEAVKALPA